MKRAFLIISTAAALFWGTVPPARAYDITLWYFTETPLMDQFQALLPGGSLVQLIYTPTGTISPPDLLTGMPTGDNVLWQWTRTFGGGHVDSDRIYDSSVDGYVYIRFFNASHLGGVTYYGLSPLHQLDEFLPEFDLWNITPMGLYLWTEYPFIIIPEPAAWLTMIPAMGMGLLAYRKSLKKKPGKKRAGRARAK